MFQKIKHKVLQQQWVIDSYNTFRFIQNLLLHDFKNWEKIRLFLTVRPYTMVDYYRLSNAYDLAILVEQQGTHGTIVECGVWRGGCACVMAYAVKKSNSNRKIWLFDSFVGLPEPSLMDGQEAKKYAFGQANGRLHSIEKCASPIEDVQTLFFTKLRIHPENVIIRKGWFQDTLPIAQKEIGPIAILRLDGDWYESTKICLDNLYANIIPGGYVIIDDYGHWEGCKKAVDEFLEKQPTFIQLYPIDQTAGRYFQKP